MDKIERLVLHLHSYQNLTGTTRLWETGAASCQVARSSGSRSRAPWSGTRASCCWTRRPRRWTMSPRRSCRRRWTGRAAAEPPWLSRTGWRRCATPMWYLRSSRGGSWSAARTPSWWTRGRCFVIIIIRI